MTEVLFFAFHSTFKSDKGYGDVSPVLALLSQRQITIYPFYQARRKNLAFSFAAFRNCCIFAEMIEKMLLYHGSNVAIEKPQILASGFYKDFGYGFYCTNLEKQARKWALTKRGNHIVSVFHYQPSDGMKVLSFPKMTDKWLDFVVEFKFPTHQIVFCTQKALGSLTYERSISL